MALHGLSPHSPSSSSISLIFLSIALASTKPTALTTLALQPAAWVVVVVVVAAAAAVLVVMVVLVVWWFGGGGGQRLSRARALTLG